MPTALPSHRVEASGRQMTQQLAPPILLASLALALAWGTAHLHPARPGAGLDFDQTLLAFKGAIARRAAAQAKPPSLLLAGDSSCLMNVSVAELDRALSAPTPSLNLGTLSYLSLDDHRRLLLATLTNQPTAIFTVVLLLHPHSLFLSSPSETHQHMLHSALANNPALAGAHSARPPSNPLSPSKAIESVRQRWLPIIAPVPLPGRYGAYYGFTTDLWRYLEKHQGSAVEPGILDPATLQGDPQPRLAPGFVEQSRAFRVGWPATTRLVIGLSPLPSSLALPDQSQRHAAVLAQWQQILGADAALTQLPAVLDDRLFATRTHLTAQAQIQYSRHLARHLAELPR